MVKLVVNNFDEVSVLQQCLNEANIDYQICFNMGHCGIEPPYIIVHGVRLDENRAKRWIKENSKNG